MSRSITFVVLVALSLANGCGENTRSEPRAADISNAREAVAESLPIAPGLENKRTFAPLADVVATVDPRRDTGWETEAVSEASLAQLKKLGKLLAHPDQRRPANLESFVSTDFQSEPLRPKCQEVFRDQAFAVLLWDATSKETTSTAEKRGNEALASVLDELAAAHGDPKNAHIRA